MYITYLYENCMLDVLIGWAKTKIDKQTKKRPLTKCGSESREKGGAKDD